MEIAAPASCLVQALLEEVTGVEEDDEQGEEVEDRRENNGEDGIWQVLLTEVKHGCVVMKDGSAATSGHVFQIRWSQDGKRRIEHFYVREQVKGDQYRDDGCLNVPFSPEPLEAHVEGSVERDHGTISIVQFYAEIGQEYQHQRIKGNNIV